jgi:hypothetical protein
MSSYAYHRLTENGWKDVPIEFEVTNLSSVALKCKTTSVFKFLKFTHPEQLLSDNNDYMLIAIDPSQSIKIRALLSPALVSDFYSWLVASSHLQ